MFGKKKNPDTPKKKKSKSREWLDAIIFAVIAATIIRTFLMEAFTIPTPSMEESLMVGDFLFVSKLNYGPRIPMTPLSLPFIHNEIFGMKSYSEAVKWGYKRLPGFSRIKNNDIVVFNYPGMPGEPDDTRPVDKKTHYIKRCIGIPGDSLKISDGVVYVNNKETTFPYRGQKIYRIFSRGFIFDKETLTQLGITSNGPGSDMIYFSENIIMMTPATALELSQMTNIDSVVPVIHPKEYPEPRIFSFDSYHQWNQDNFGPLYIPKKGDVIPISVRNISVYRRAIAKYEGNALEEKDGKIFINGKEATSYQFKMDYYFMMGDNRYNSLDCRYWGFVPEDHVAGKAVFVWLSIDYDANLLHKIRWSRMMRFIHWGDKV